MISNKQTQKETIYNLKSYKSDCEVLLKKLRNKLKKILVILKMIEYIENEIIKTENQILKKN